MEDMVLAGMTPMQVIVAATRNGAEFLRITRQQGAASTLYETLRRSRWELLRPQPGEVECDWGAHGARNRRYAPGHAVAAHQLDWRVVEAAVDVDLLVRG
jgi:hypothetical protein